MQYLYTTFHLISSLIVNPIDPDFFPQVPLSMYQFYLDMVETGRITYRIIESSSSITQVNPITYVDAYTTEVVTSNYKNVFSDNNYWNKYNGKSFYLTKNTTNWNLLNFNLDFYLNTYDKWISLYPQNVDKLEWQSKSQNNFKLIFYGFHTSVFDITYLDNRIFKHHDYQLDVYYGSNIFWHMNCPQNQLKGAFIFWYEPFGAMEAFYMNYWAFWYQFWYPDYEEMIFLDNLSSVSNKYWMFQDSPFGNKIYDTFWDRTKFLARQNVIME